ncbi:MBL fold metallo-hydrolase [Vibrio sp. RW]|uniref:MBL fold metallo-hydrolase n=1 Tax=Vibrio sp. RW TaxID=2998833 RepID=UPI0022CDBC62|nr:MBL fold metallo-hydrolase [Vibrio sp. RW]MDA0146141.1 MBL fold metallo-hydrolase [Vibrio sp. RW]
MQIHTIKGYIQDMYLVEYPDRLLLLDGACRADIPHLKAFIEDELGREFNDLHTVVVTHMHPDHAGAAHKLRKLTNCNLVAANRDKDWYQGVDGILMHLTDLALARWMANRLGKPKANLWYSRKLKPDYKLSDGDSIPGFDDWLVLETPGHTDRDLSVYCPSHSVAYVADLMVEVKKKLIPPFPIFHPNQYRESVSRIYDMQVDTLLVAHGGQVDFSQTAFEHLLTSAPRRPVTHWRVTKIKMKNLLLSIWRFGFQYHGKS